MKKKSRLFMVFFGVLFFATSGVAQAVNFSISDIQFTDLIGQNEKFEWWLSVLSVSNFDIAVGASHTFTYGKFHSNDKPFNDDDNNDNDDSFKANFLVTPPGAAVFSIGKPDALIISGPDYSWVNFDNVPINKTFGTGGSYEITFFDTDGITVEENGVVDLNAKIKLISDVTPPPTNGVPEPTTMLLLGLGLVGLVGVRKFKK